MNKCRIAGALWISGLYNKSYNGLRRVHNSIITTNPAAVTAIWFVFGVNWRAIINPVIAMVTGF